jgi:hypothetical protein
MKPRIWQLGLETSSQVVVPQDPHEFITDLDKRESVESSSKNDQ